jgi:hypothetical protein
VLAGLVALSAWLVREMRLNQRQRAFLDAVTHEMRTPLASLRLYLDTLGPSRPDPEQRRAFLGRMQRDVDRLDHTVEQVLHAARAEEHRRGLPTEQVRSCRCSTSASRSCARVTSCPRRRCSSTDARSGGARQPRRARGGVPQPARERREVFERPSRSACAYREGRRPRRRRDLRPRDRHPARELRKIFQRFYRAGRDVQRTAVGLGPRAVHRAQPRARQGGRVVARSEGSGAGAVSSSRCARPCRRSA